MTRARGITADEVLRPMSMTCGACEGTLTVYPDAEGHGYCPCSTPAWAQSFFLFLTNQARAAVGLDPLPEAVTA